MDGEHAGGSSFSGRLVRWETIERKRLVQQTGHAAWLGLDNMSAPCFAR